MVGRTFVVAVILASPLAAGAHVFQLATEEWLPDVMVPGETQDVTAYFIRTCPLIVDGPLLPVDVELFGQAPEGYAFEFLGPVSLPQFACRPGASEQEIQVPYRITATRDAEGAKQHTLEVGISVPPDTPPRVAASEAPHTAVGITILESEIVVEDAWIRGPASPVMASEIRFTEFPIEVGVRSNAIADVQLIVVDAAGGFWDLPGVVALGQSGLDTEQTKSIPAGIWAINGGDLATATIGMEVRSWPGDPPYAYVETQIAFQPEVVEEEESAAFGVVPLMAAIALLARRWAA